jgi:lysozyme family protein
MPTAEEVIQRTLDKIIAREGGFVNHPDDRGGPTCFGITHDALVAWRKEPVTDNDISGLGEDEARAIYRSLYMDGPGYTFIEHSGLFDLVVDTAVQFGPLRATKWLQAAVRVPVDGVIGPMTRQCVKSAFAPTVFADVLTQRIMHRGEVLSAHHDQAVFAKGWLYRDAEFVRMTARM